MTVEIDKNAEPFLFDGPIPGQSLTNTKENSYAWEQAPEITSHCLLYTSPSPRDRG